AIASYDKAIELRPDYADALNNRGLTMLALKRYPEAFADYKAVLAINPNHAHALAGLADVALKTCDWARAKALMPRLQSDIASGAATRKGKLDIFAVDFDRLHQPPAAATAV